MCILLYVKLIWCSGVPEIYGQLEEGVKLIWCSAAPWIYGQLEEVGMSVLGICAFFYM